MNSNAPGDIPSAERGLGYTTQRGPSGNSVCEEGFWPWLITKGYLQFNAAGREKEQQESLHTYEVGQRSNIVSECSIDETTMGIMHPGERASLRGLLKIIESREKISMNDSWPEKHILPWEMNGNQTISFTTEKAQAIWSGSWVEIWHQAVLLANKSTVRTQ